MLRVSILVLSLLGGCTELRQQVQARHAQFYQCRPGWVEVTSLGFEASTSRYVAHGCGHTVVYACMRGRPCEAQSDGATEPPDAATPAR